jgi:FlaA1/EpsC-like NDP-sugar epimerase
VKINDLAELMIRLSGLEIRTEQQPDGDIEVVYTGLRPGEKLYEELLIGANTSGTEHPRILRSDEPTLSPSELRRELELLKAAMATRDVETIQAVLMRTVEGYQPDSTTRAAGHAGPVSLALPSRTLH